MKTKCFVEVDVNLVVYFRSCELKGSLASYLHESVDTCTTRAHSSLPSVPPIQNLVMQAGEAYKRICCDNYMSAASKIPQAHRDKRLPISSHESDFPQTHRVFFQ
jgi:hypothetical protein